MNRRGLAGLLLAGLWLAPPAIRSTAADEPTPAAIPDAPALPWTAERIWLRQPGRRGHLKGDLVVTERNLEVIGRKQRVAYALDTLRLVSYGRLKAADNDWILIKIERGGRTEILGLRDGNNLGYGTATPQIYAKLKSTLRGLAAAQYAVPRNYRTYDELDTTITFAVPQSWSAHHRTLTRVSGGPWYGTLLFAAEELAGLELNGREAQPESPALARLNRGEIPAFFVHRREAGPGSSCSGLDERAARSIVAWSAAEELLGADQAALEAAAVEPLVIDGCNGLVFRATSTVDGIAKAIELCAVSDGTTLVLIGARSAAGQDEVLRGALQQLVDSLQFSLAR